ncbi:MAG: selenium cofactor biosynthesis protein YqeC [Candidatus Binatia bacterium]
MTLRDAFGLKHHGMLSLIGAGGKTTTLFRLADELYQDGSKVLITTTTKIFKPMKPHVHRLFLARALDALLSELQKMKAPVIVGTGRELDDAGKLIGLPLEWFDTLAIKGAMDWLLVEADGAASRPFKVPAEHEPVIPEGSSPTIWVVGIKVLGHPLTVEWVHRPERALALLGLERETAVTEDIIVNLIKNPRGCLKGVSPGSRKVGLINQADSEDEVKKAGDLAHTLIRHGFERVVITSYLDDDPVKDVITQ